MRSVYVMGDVHGYYDRLVALLQQHDLIDEHLAWCGGSAALWCMGDFFDNGPRGIDAARLIRDLQQMAPAAGGYVQAVIGNHDILFLAAARFGNLTTKRQNGTYTEKWIENSGIRRDMELLTPELRDWLSDLPALLVAEDRLFVHADSLLYFEYGNSVESINRDFKYILHSDWAPDWETLLEFFRSHGVYYPNESDRARDVLARLGGSQIIHGHTPVSSMTKQPPSTVTAALIYADDLVVDADGGIYKGGPGFLYRFESAD